MEVRTVTYVPTNDESLVFCTWYHCSEGNENRQTQMFISRDGLEESSSGIKTAYDKTEHQLHAHLFCLA
eukprot:659418-Amphidinium_carterae.2